MSELAKAEPSQYIHFPGMKWHVIDIGVARSEKRGDWVAVTAMQVDYFYRLFYRYFGPSRDAAIVGVLREAYYFWRQQRKLPPAAGASVSVILPQVGWTRLVVSYDEIPPLDKPHRVWLDATLPNGVTYEGKGKADTFDAGIDLCCEDIRQQIKRGG
jgi:hypothetical protein